MKKLLFLGLVLLGVGLVSCNKNQKAVKKLDGEWTVTKFLTPNEETGELEDLAAGDVKLSMEFGTCKLKDDEWCTYKFSAGAVSVNSFYQITDGGDILEIREDIATSDEDFFTIVELSKDEALLEQYYADGTQSTINLEKK